MPTDAADRVAAGGGRRLCVAVVSDQRLVAEAVVSALRSQDVDVATMVWPRGSRAAEPVGRQLDAAAPDVALLLYDVDMTLRMSVATALIRSWSGPWVVLTTARPGAAWGGLRAAGASAVAPADSTLLELDALLHRVAGGGSPPDVELLEYAHAWRDVQKRHAELQLRIDSLAPREREVLGLLRRGARVADIALQWNLSETTVRTQVRAVLRKLGVRSQLAAVALLRSVEQSAGEQSAGEAPEVPAPRSEDEI